MRPNRVKKLLHAPFFVLAPLLDVKLQLAYRRIQHNLILIIVGCEGDSEVQPLALIEDIRVVVHLLVDRAGNVHVLPEEHVVGLEDGEAEQDYHEEDGHEGAHARRQGNDALRESHLVLVAKLVPA